MKTGATNRFGLSLVAYLVLVLVTIWVIGANLLPGWELPLALIPLVPGFAIVYYGLLAIRQMDELQRRVLLETLGFAFGGFFMLLVTENLLFVLGLQQRTGPGTYLMYMFAMWLIGYLIARRRYE